MQYNQYLQTPSWKATRQKKLVAAPHCQICKSTENLNIHHKRYYIPEKIALHERRESGSILFNEQINDLMTLCASCHKLWHHYYGKNYLRHKTASKIRRLIKYGCQPGVAFKISKEPHAYGVILTNLKRMIGEI